MLTQIDIELFKCFELLHLPLCQLTLLSGSNASGKSSVLQTLVLLHQTMLEHEWSTRLMLNGNSIRLGTISDVVDHKYGRQSFNIGINDNDSYYAWIFEGNRSEMSMQVVSVAADGCTHPKPELMRHLLPPQIHDTIGRSFTSRMCGLTYISAERVGPREVYALEDRQMSTVVGPAGENAMSVLHWKRDEAVLNKISLSQVPNKLFNQVEERMQQFFPGFTMELPEIRKMNAVTLGMRISSDTDFHRPINVGFGITQVLPIVIAALSAGKDDLLLIENPEVHLHPAAQALMGQFLADVARAGVQVIVETHSDHILNGIRRSVKAGRLTSEQVALHFFRPRSDNMAQVYSPMLDNSGNIDSWPDGFFDQFEKDMNHFAGWGE